MVSSLLSTPNEQLVATTTHHPSAAADQPEVKGTKISSPDDYCATLSLVERVCALHFNGRQQKA
jgi:hypothetical protein